VGLTRAAPTRAAPTDDSSPSDTSNLVDGAFASGAMGSLPPRIRPTNVHTCHEVLSRVWTGPCAPSSCSRRTCTRASLPEISVASKGSSSSSSSRTDRNIRSCAPPLGLRLLGCKGEQRAGPVPLDLRLMLQAYSLSRFRERSSPPEEMFSSSLRLPATLLSSSSHQQPLPLLEGQ
jgi:hypothetical protein